jgi:hypothetical protein
MAAGWRPGITHWLRPRETILGGAIKTQQSCATFRNQHARVEGHVRGAMEKEKGAFEDPIFVLPPSSSGPCPLRLALKLPATNTRLWPSRANEGYRFVVRNLSLGGALGQDLRARREGPVVADCRWPRTTASWTSIACPAKAQLRAPEGGVVDALSQNCLGAPSPTLRDES